MASLTLLIASRVTGEKMSSLSPGMTKDQVISLLGRPDGYQAEGDSGASDFLTVDTKKKHEWVHLVAPRFYLPQRPEDGTWVVIDRAWDLHLGKPLCYAV